MSYHENEVTSAATVSCAESADRITISAPAISASFSRRDGALLSLLARSNQYEMIADDRAVRPRMLWRLTLRAETGEAVFINSGECETFTCCPDPDLPKESARIWLRWCGFQSNGKVIPACLALQVRCSEAAPYLLFEAVLELPTGWEVSEFRFPMLPVAERDDPLDEISLVLPVAEGCLLPSPRQALTNEESQELVLRYPDAASMQLLGCCFGDRTALWIAPLDTSAQHKDLVVGPSPSSRQVDLSLVHKLTLRPDGYWASGYPIAVGAVAGDWFEVAREYRTWATAQQWAARGRGLGRAVPPLTRLFGLWASHHLSPREGVAAARELQRALNAPVKLDWGWRGDDAKVSEAITQLDEAGIRCQLSLPIDEHLAEAARVAVAQGADGVRLEVVDRERGGNELRPVAEALQELRHLVGEGIQLAVSGPQERLLQQADSFFAAAPRSISSNDPSDAWRRQATPIPLFSSVYHDYIAVAAEPVDLTLPEETFTFQVAQAFTWGQQLLLDNFSPAQAREDSNRRKLAFLSAALRAQAWGVGALLPQAEFMGLIAVHSRLLTPPRSSPPATRLRRHHAVIGAVWRMPTGGGVLTLVNHTAIPVDFSAYLKTSRLGVQLPLRLTGRVFAEDGDAPAVSLRASGAEVTGKLPRRAILLASVG